MAFNSKIFGVFPTLVRCTLVWPTLHWWYVRPVCDPPLNCPIQWRWYPRPPLRCFTALLVQTVLHSGIADGWWSEGGLLRREVIFDKALRSPILRCEYGSMCTHTKERLKHITQGFIGKNGLSWCDIIARDPAGEVHRWLGRPPERKSESISFYTDVNCCRLTKR